MSLKEEIQAVLDAGHHASEVVEHIDNVVLYQDNITDCNRWSNSHESVYLKKTVLTVNPEITYMEEYVQVNYEIPHGEDADWEEFSTAEVFDVEPQRVRVIEFTRK